MAQVKGVNRAAVARFPGTWDKVRELLYSFTGPERLRVRLAILVLAGRSRRQVAEMVAAANLDYRSHGICGRRR